MYGDIFTITYNINLYAIEYNLLQTLMTLFLLIIYIFNVGTITNILLFYIIYN